MLASDDDILLEAERWTRAGRGVAIATVVETWGSAPRAAGSHLFIAADGDFLGSVSGGCVESEVIADGQSLILTGGLRLLEFGVSDETAWRAGLSCGGRIKVLLRPLSADLIAQINLLRAARKGCALLTGLSSGAERIVQAAEGENDPLCAEINTLLAARKSRLLQEPDEQIFVSIFAPPPRLVAIGAVHISQALAPMAMLAGFETTIIDPRAAYANEARFPGARLIADWPGETLAALAPDGATAIALLTHVPQIDDEAATVALNSDCFYIGALGSRNTHARRIERLRKAGFGESALDRIHAPIGLDIGARSPAEIAVAILSEIIQSLRRGESRRASGEAA